MRPILHSDLLQVARALLLLPQDARAGQCAAIFERAEAADRYVKRFRRLHPEWGNGSLWSASQNWPKAPDPGLGNLDFCRCLSLVLAAVMARRKQGS